MRSTPTARLASDADLLPLRTRRRAEMNCQIVHDAVHSRIGWTREYLVELDSNPVCFASVAIGGPWKEKPTLLDFYVLPEHRSRTFELFQAFTQVTKPRFFEIQSNDKSALVIAGAFGREIESEKIVFEDCLTTNLECKGGVLKNQTPEGEIVEAIQQRQGGGEWVLEVDGNPVGKGGVLFHYNPPYGDIYMEIEEPFRRRGFGSFLVQELKSICYKLGGIPAARCSPPNIASRLTLSRAGFAPYAHILMGKLALE